MFGKTTAKFLKAVTLVVLSVMALGMPDAQARDKEFVVCIDPGHGGHDAGALGDKTNEKSVNLGVALKLQRLLDEKMKDVKVVMTRDDDTFVPLQGRADFANRKKADIFVSIHANSIDRKAKNRKTINGAAVYTLGLDRSDTNLAVAMRENEVMKMEKDYKQVYQGFDPSSTESYIAFEMMQHANLNNSIHLAGEVQKELVKTAGRKNNGVKQAPFWVLVRTSMPAILVELDFICNPQMEKFMASADGQNKLARAIYNGIASYRGMKPASEDKARKTRKADPQPETTLAKSATASDGRTVYKVQFLTAPRELDPSDRRLRGIKDAGFYKDGSTVKYTAGEYATLAEANRRLKTIKKTYPDAFVIKMRDGKRIK